MSLICRAWKPGMMKFQMSNYDIVQLCNDAVGMAHMQNSTLHTHFISNIDEYIIHTDTNRFMQFVVSILTCPFASFKEERDLNFTLNKNGEILRFKITNAPSQTSNMPIKTLLCVMMSTVCL